MSQQTRPVAHATFSIDRVYDASPERVFAAFSDQRSKRKWFAEGEGWEIERFEMDFRPHGIERSEFRFQGGPLIENHTVYQDIVPDRRIIISYTMTVDQKRISASLATIEIDASGTGARLTYTEQGAFLEGPEQVGDRETGWRELLESLAHALS